MTTKRDWNEAEHDLQAEMGYSHIWKRLNAIENILGDTYDLDRLRKLMEADREGRLMVVPYEPDIVLKDEPWGVLLTAQKGDRNG